MAGNRLASFYTCPRLVNPRASLIMPQGGVIPLGEIDTVDMFFGEHNRPCYGGANCDSRWREENTRSLESMLTPHRNYHVACGGNQAEEFCLNAELIEDRSIFEHVLHILLQKERDWMAIHPNAEPYPHTTPKMYDIRNPNARPSSGV